VYTSKTCRYIMPTGRTCKSPAMRGSAYCYYHDPQKSPSRVSKVTESEFEIEPLTDPSSIPAIANQILLAMAANRISKSRAAVMFQGLQTVMASYQLALADDLDHITEPANEPGPDAQSYLNQTEELEPHHTMFSSSPAAQTHDPQTPGCTTSRVRKTSL
jgi:hypothetical protein